MQKSQKCWLIMNWTVCSLFVFFFFFVIFINNNISSHYIYLNCITKWNRSFSKKHWILLPFMCHDHNNNNSNKKKNNYNNLYFGKHKIINNSHQLIWSDTKIYFSFFLPKTSEKKFFVRFKIRWANSLQNHREIAKGFFFCKLIFVVSFCLDRRPFWKRRKKISWKFVCLFFNLFELGGRIVYITDVFLN